MQKYHYLAQLDGTAAQVIKTVKFSTTGLSFAWSALCERYNNKKLLVHNDERALFTLEWIQKECSFRIK